MAAIWDDRIGALTTEHQDIPAAVVAATLSLLSARGPLASQPSEIARGHWPTICLTWLVGEMTVEVEVSLTDYEYYGPDSRRLDIRHFAHAGGEVVAKELLALLPP